MRGGLLLRHIRVDPAACGERIARLPFLSAVPVDIELRSPLTMLIGENGSGKTTLLEAVAARCAIRPGGGGSYAETDDDHAGTALSDAVTVTFGGHRPKGLFLRADRFAETMAQAGRLPMPGTNEWRLADGKTRKFRAHPARIQKPKPPPARYQHIQRRHIPVHQHCVDHHLEEQRRHQPKNVEHEGADEDFAQEMPIFFDGGEEPGDVEGFVQVSEAGTLGDENEGAVPDFFKLFTREEFRLLDKAVQDKGFTSNHSSKNEEAKNIRPCCNDGQGSCAKPIPCNVIN